MSTTFGFKGFKKRDDGALLGHNNIVYMEGDVAVFCNDDALVPRNGLDFYKKLEDVLLFYYDRGGTAFHRVEVFGEVVDDKDGMRSICQSLKVLERVDITKAIAIAAVRKCGAVVDHLSEEFRADKEIGLAAVAQDGGAVHWISKELRNDKDICLAARI